MINYTIYHWKVFNVWCEICFKRKWTRVVKYPLFNNIVFHSNYFTSIISIMLCVSSMNFLLITHELVFVICVCLRGSLFSSSTVKSSYLISLCITKFFPVKLLRREKIRRFPENALSPKSLFTQRLSRHLN